MKNPRTFLLTVLLIYGLLFSIFAIAGCSSKIITTDTKNATNITTTSQNKYYKISSVHKGIPFSFEVPSTYQTKIGILKSFTMPGDSFSLERIDEKNTWDNSDTHLIISITDISETGNAKAHLDSIIQDITSTDPANQTKIIDNSSLKIADVDGYTLSYSAVYSKPHYLTDVFFDYKGEIWWINLDTSGNAIEQSKPEFTHIIDTFKFE